MLYAFYAYMHDHESWLFEILAEIIFKREKLRESNNGFKSIMDAKSILNVSFLLEATYCALLPQCLQYNSSAWCSGIIHKTENSQSSLQA